MTNVIDLAVVREWIEAERQIANNIAQRLSAFLVMEAIRQAERAFAVAGPIAMADEDISRIVHRGVLRRLRADMRRAFKGRPAELQLWAVEKAVQIYEGRVIALVDERDGSGLSRHRG